MPDFPSLKPSTISYDLGGLNVTDEDTTTAGPIRFRHSLRINNHSFVLNYSNLTESEMVLIRSHYENSGGSHYAFKVPSTAWGSADVVPSTSLYRYTEKPEESQFGVYHNVTVNLTILAANDLLYILSGEPAALGAVAAFSSFAFDGNAPFILDNDDAVPAISATMILKAGGADL
tara:strand:- start:16 stop:540 length:525 start_codon:yes stop_codon:yes gene_type:complete